MSASVPAARPRSISQPALWVALAALLGGLRLFLRAPSTNLLGLPALLETGFTLALLGAVLVLAGGLGRKCLRGFALDGLTGLERLVIGTSLGLGLLAYGVLALGLAGLLHPWAVLLGLAGAGWWVRSDLGEIAAQVSVRLERLRGDWRRLFPPEKVVALLGSLILLLSGLQALVPPVEYDALMYHLRAPALYLQAGRLLFLPEVWQANGPSTPAMLFTLGLAFGSDTFSKAIHLATAVLLVLGTFSFAKRFMGRRLAWMAVAALLGVPAYAFWAGQALTDITWALFQFLSIYAFLLWLESGGRRYLALSGALMGLALGSKYLALAGFGILGLWALGQARRIGWRQAFSGAALFGATAVLVASPWYLKNWVWSGNPVYPFYLGGPGWDPARLDLLMTFLRSFGAGSRWQDILLLPVNLYIHYDRFSTNAGIELPGLLFPLVLVYPWSGRTRPLNHLAGITALFFAAWVAGSQQ
ncbi:MAG TPA: glycosyltransferase family 39 protein, partial [Anaerolineales bacterium]